ncbi:MAG: N-acetyltransferase [Pseudobdellovibrio sp.]
MITNLNIKYFSEPILFPLSIGQTALMNEQIVFIKGPNHLSESKKQICNEIMTLKDLPKNKNILYPIDCLDELNLVFPFIKESLFDHYGKLSEQQIIENILKPLLVTVDSLHQNGIIHCDIKLENIRINEELKIFLTDFGSAKKNNEFNPNIVGALSQHKPADITFGPGYDLFSVGVLIYQLFFGLNFMRDFQLKGRSFKNIPESANVSEKIKQFIFAATEYNVANRFKSAKQAYSFIFSCECNIAEQVVIEPYSLDNYFETYLEFMKQTFQASDHSLSRFNDFIGENGESYYQRLLRWSRSSQAVVLHIKKGEDILGILEASIGKDGSGLISTIFIRPEFRSKGYAEQLGKSAIEFFKLNKCAEIYLNVDENNLRAIAFYKKSGWVETEGSIYPNSKKFQFKI